MSELLNLVGLSTGVVLYAMLLAMVFAPDARVAPLASIRCCSRPPLLGLVWNLCALPAYELPKVGIAGPFTVPDRGRLLRPRLPARRRRALGPARRARRASVRGWPKRTVACAAYAVSAIAAALHALARMDRRPLPSPSACVCSPTRSSRW